MSLSQGGVSPREPPSNASLCARVTTLLVRQGSGSAAVPQTVRPRARKLIPQARKLVPSRPSSVHSPRCIATPAMHARHTCHTRHAALVALTAIAAVAAANTSREHHPATLAAPAHHTRNTPMQSASPLPCLSSLVLTSRNPVPLRSRSLPHRSLPHMRSASPLRSSSGALAAFATLVTLVALAALKAQPNRPASTRCRLRAGPHVGHRPR